MQRDLELAIIEMLIDDNSNLILDNITSHLKFSYTSIFLFKISSKGPISLLNECLSIDTTTHSLFAITFAARGSFFSKALSPK